mgnify:CR=1 FL=1
MSTTRKTKRPLVCSFPPTAAPDARVLILGTVPSVVSLATQQSYGHPQNAFWRIMGQLFGAGLDVPYDERKRILCENGVAMWDVLRECYRDGSLDSAIELESEVPNDFVPFLRKHRSIHTIFFNGQKAETAFRRHSLSVVAKLNREFTYTRLPSTSPAHAGRNLSQKLAAWQAVSYALK